jgi:hypothetical protein
VVWGVREQKEIRLRQNKLKKEKATVGQSRKWRGTFEIINKYMKTKASWEEGKRKGVKAKNTEEGPNGNKWGR